MQDLIAGGSATNLPAHAQAETSSNLAGDMVGQGFPKLTFKGNRFRVKSGGDERVIGGMELAIVIVEANPHVSRIYYEGKYDPEGSDRPACGSEDGIVPLPSVANPPSDKCATCPMNEKGSAVTDTGGKTRACSFYKRMVVLLADSPEAGPFVADMKSMTMFGDSYPDKGQFSLRDYAKRLDQNKVAPYAVVTTLSFDENQSVPKVMFTATDYTSAEFHGEFVEPLLDSGELANMVSTGDITVGDADEDQSEFKDKLLSKPDPKEEEPEPEPEPEPEQEEEEAPKPKKKVAKKKAAKKKAAKKPEPEPEEEEQEEEEEDDAEVAFDDDLEAALADFDFD